ncbi:MAG: ABC transporter ATP-binding protein [Clostridia bacterium]|nr:ABC transporter ATP-binding protein [Clostridia bacterium]
MNNESALLSVRHAVYDYRTKAETVHALRDVSLDFHAGMMYAVVGRSGSGKSTLLSMIAGFDRLKAGEILVNGENLSKMDPETYRRKHVGMVFQAYHLIPQLTVSENIRLAMEIAGYVCNDVHSYVNTLLEKVGLDASYAKKRVTRLSGGEQQRVAVARAVSTHADILLADEPTGNLDDENAEMIVDLLYRMAHEDGKCVIMVTHSLELAQKCDQIYRLAGGKNVAEV